MMTPPAAAGSRPDLMFLLSWATQAMHAAHAEGLAEVGLSPRAYFVLFAASTGELTQKQIGERCGVDKTTMVVTLDQLERAELVHRRTSDTDRRARLVEVTPAGLEALALAQHIVRRIQDDVIATLPPEEGEAFLKSLERLVTTRFQGRGGCGPCGAE